MGFLAGDANLYRYVGNNPTNATDPTGLRLVKVTTHLRSAGFVNAAQFVARYITPKLPVTRLNDPMTIEKDLRDDAAAVEQRLVEARKEVESALRPGTAHWWAPANVVLRATQENPFLLNGQDIATELRWVLGSLSSKLGQLLQFMAGEWHIDYWDYGTIWYNRELVDDAYSGWVSSTHNRPFNSITITEKGWDVRFAPTKADQQLHRRGTILHELTHLVLNTKDRALGESVKDPYDPDSRVIHRELDDSYWWELFYQTPDASRDFDNALGYLLDDVLRTDYPVGGPLRKKSAVR